MKRHQPFPADLAFLSGVPILAVILLMSTVFRVINRLRHPTPQVWLWVLGIAFSISTLAAVFLFIAKLVRVPTSESVGGTSRRKPNASTASRVTSGCPPIRVTSSHEATLRERAVAGL
jgi:hypothetical protein